MMIWVDRILVYATLGVIIGHQFAMADVTRNAAWDAHAARDEIAALKKDITDMKDALNAVIQVPQ